MGATPLFTDEYDRRRRQPMPGDEDYVHLKDLADVLRSRLADARGLWLDYGSGTSPYADYASDARMLIADVSDGADPAPRPLDFELEPGRPCPAEDTTFDGVLSTQVLEHVPDPGFYLRDAYRLLRPGGQLVLTTHGSYEEHPCPLDLTRWTAQGLREEVSAAGFEVVECVPLTCGLRGALMLLRRELEKVRWWRFLTPRGAPLALIRLVTRLRPASLDRFADGSLGEQGVGIEGRDRLYIDLLVTARRPG
jgi:SAM-dependent methyltransferase